MAKQFALTSLQIEAWLTKIYVLQDDLPADPETQTPWCQKVESHCRQAASALQHLQRLLEDAEMEAALREEEAYMRLQDELRLSAEEASAEAACSNREALREYQGFNDFPIETVPESSDDLPF